MARMFSATRGAAAAALIAAAALGLGVLAFVSAGAGYLVGIAAILVVLAFGSLVTLRTQGAAPRQTAALPHDRNWLLAGAVAVIAVTVALALGYPQFPWPVLLLGGVLLLHTFYGLAHPAEEAEAIRAGVTAAAADGRERAQAGSVEASLRDVDLFRGLSGRQMREVAELGQVRWVPQGGSLGVEGQAGSEVYVVLSGRAELTANSSVGRINVRVAGPGESFPLAALLGDGTLITSAQAMTPMEVWAVDRGRLLQHCRASPQTGAAIYAEAARILGERYRRTLWRLTRSSAQAMRDADLWVNV